MSGSVKQILSATVLLIGAYLVLVHFAGFAADVNAVGTNYGSIVKDLQGRG